MIKEVLDNTMIEINVSHLNMLYKPNEINKLVVGMEEFIISIDGVESCHGYDEVIDNMGNDILDIIEILRNVYFNYKHKYFSSAEKYKIIHKEEIYDIIKNNIDGSFRTVNLGKVVRTIESILDLDYFKELYRFNNIANGNIQFLSSQVVGGFDSRKVIDIDDFEELGDIEYRLSFSIRGKMKYLNIASGGDKTIYGPYDQGVFINSTNMSSDDIDIILATMSLIEYSMWNQVPRHIDLTTNMDAPLYLSSTNYKSIGYEKSLVRTLRGINRDIVNSNAHYQAIDDIMDYVIAKYRIYISFNDVKLHPSAHNTLDISRGFYGNVTGIKVRIYNEEFEIVSANTLIYDVIDKNTKVSYNDIFTTFKYTNDDIDFKGDHYPYHENMEVERSELNIMAIYVYSKLIIDLVDDSKNGTCKFKDTYGDYLHLLDKEDVDYVNKVVERLNNGKYGK